MANQKMRGDKWVTDGCVLCIDIVRRLTSPSNINKLPRCPG